MTDLYESKERPIPYTTAWAVRCPCCDQELFYDVEEDDSGVFGLDPANIPICEPCNLLFLPQSVEVKVMPDEAT